MQHLTKQLLLSQPGPLRLIKAGCTPSIIASFAGLQFLQICTTFLQYGVRSLALTVHTELCSLVLTVNCCKIEKLLTAVVLQ